MVRVLIPLAVHDPDDIAAAVSLALASAPDYPDRNAY